MIINHFVTLPLLKPTHSSFFYNLSRKEQVDPLHRVQQISGQVTGKVCIC